MQYSHVDFKRLNTLIAITPISLNTTTNSHGIVKWMKKLTYLNSKPRRVNHVLTLLSAPTAKTSIKPIQIYAPSRNIASTTIGITKNNKSFARVEATQFAQP